MGEGKSRWITSSSPPITPNSSNLSGAPLHTSHVLDGRDRKRRRMGTACARRQAAARVSLFTPRVYRHLRFKPKSLPREIQSSSSRGSSINAREMTSTRSVAPC
ncbi:hypothetical protein PUN28_020171 [Cardiocondyla obscurior]|uniref:Uncharacterized protein n=1 Tax=Cardiocondyla obscurior TaxID=286306 RepID=A0AAW2E701_9HYME